MFCFVSRLRVGFAVAVCAAMLPAASMAQTQLEYNQRANQEFQKADKALNTAYTQLMAKVSAKGKLSLRQAQRSWLKFRDDNCAFSTLGVEGGSIRPMMYSQCLTDVTAQRTRELSRHMHCEEGGISCGGQ